MILLPRKRILTPRSAQGGFFTLPGGMGIHKPGGGGGAGAYWDPSRKSSTFNLSNSDKDATATASSDHESLYGLTGRDAASDTRYFEVVVITGTTSGQIGVGIGNSSAVTNNYAGSTVNGCSYQSNGNVFHTGAVVATLGTYSAGAVIGVQLKNGKLYMRRNNTNWLNSGDPDGAETGFILSGLTGAYYPAGSMFTTNNKIQLRVLSSEFSWSMAAGSQAWGA